MNGVAPFPLFTSGVFWDCHKTNIVFGAMVGAAFVHFVLVELRPMIAATVSSLSIAGTMYNQAYNSQVACTCMPNCTQEETIDQNANLLRQAMTSFTESFSATGKCGSIDIVENVHYGPWFFGLLVSINGMIISVSIVLFLVEACKRRFTSIQSGAYLVFTLELEHRCVYRMAIRTYLISLWLAFIAGTVLLLLRTKNFGLVWKIISREIIPFLVLLQSGQNLLSPTNIQEFSSWDIAKLRRIRFRRSFCNIFFDANDALYHRIGVATMEATRGNTSYLKALVLRHGDAYELMQAVGLPFDWASLLPDIPAATVSDSKELGTENSCVVEANAELSGTKRSL